MDVVSLFAGIGGFDLGFDHAGFRIVGHVERDANCRKLLAEKWPDAVALDDVCTAGAHNLPPCDVVTFGFPCQDLSVAGKRAGLAGGRSGLFYEATRIIDELKPAYCLFENVPGLLSSDGGMDFWRVLRQMDEIGYHGAWRTLDAQWFGVAQRRRRVFGLFSLLDSGAERCAQVLSLGESLRGHPAPSREAGKVAPCLAASGVGAGRTGNERNEVDFCIEQATIPLQEVGKRTGISTDDKRAGIGIGNESDPMFTLQAGAQHGLAVAGTLAGAGGGNGLSVAFHDVAGTLKDRGGNHAGNGAEEADRIVGCRDVAQAITQNYGKQPDNSDTALGPNVVGCVEIRGRDDGRTLEARYDGTANALRTPNGGRDGMGVGAVHAAMSVRRLTPTECERLQGFPDGWTAGFSDSTRYKMLGNAVCVKVSEWIAMRLAKEFK